MAIIQLFVKQNKDIIDEVETNFYHNKVKEKLISAFQPMFHSTIYFSLFCGLLKKPRSIRTVLISGLTYYHA